MTMVTLLAQAPNTASRWVWNWKRKDNSADQASASMLQLRRSNLEVWLQCIDAETLSEHQKQILSKVTEMLRAPMQSGDIDSQSAWDEIYKLERLSALLFNGAQLRQEIVRRLAELAEQNVSKSECLRHEYEALTGTPDKPSPPVDDGVLHAFLLRLMEALQWAAKKTYLVRPIRKDATKKILVCVFTAFLLLIIPYLLLSANYRSSGELVSRWWSHLALYTAVISGALGAFFSRLIVLQRDWPNMPLEEVCLHNEWSYALLRAGVGMCGALILFYLFVSDLINGSVFPHVERFAINLLDVPPPGVSMAFATPSKDLALLTVWCVLAGFSEQLVPSLLAKTERQLGQACKIPGVTPAN
jgi:hypothetical protein